MIRILVLLVLGAVGWWVWREIRGPRDRQLEAWKALAAESPRLQEAIAHRARLLKALGARSRLGGALRQQVDAVLESMADIVRRGGDPQALREAAAEVAAAADEAESLAGEARGIDAARDRLDARTERLRASVEGYAEVRREDEV